MKRLICIVLIVICMFSLFSCGDKEVNYERELFKQSDEIKADIKKDVKKFKRQGVVLNIEVEKISKDLYEVDLAGDKQRHKFYSEEDDELQLNRVCELVDQYQSIATRAKDSVINYINSSNVLQDKEMLIEEINKINVKVAEMDTVGLYREGTIYISKDVLKYYPEVATEYALAHEYVHALAAITNDGIDNEVYGKNKFNEAITDIITVQLYPNGSGFESAYADYYYYVLGYIACFKEEALEAYFYGYEDIWESVGRDEFDFFVEMFANAPNNAYAHMCYDALINKWI